MVHSHSLFMSGGGGKFDQTCAERKVYVRIGPLSQSHCSLALNKLDWQKVGRGKGIQNVGRNFATQRQSLRNAADTALSGEVPTSPLRPREDADQEGERGRRE